MSKLQKNTPAIPPLPSYPCRDDGISLVEITKILIKHRRLMTIVFIITLVAAVVFTFVQPKKYEYITIYTMAESDVGQPLENAATLKAKLESLYVPELVESFLQKHNLERLPFKFTINNPDSSNLITIETTSVEKNKEQLQELHKALAAKMLEKQNNIIKRKTALMEEQIESAQEQIQLATELNFSKAGELIASNTSQANALHTQINSFEKGRITTIAKPSLEPKNLSKKVTLVMGVILGIILSLLAVLGQEFMKKLRVATNED